MANQNLIHETHLDFSGGVNQNTGRLLQADNEVDYAENATLEEIGPVYKCKGYLQRGGDVNDTYEILGMASSYKADGTMKQIAVADGAASSDAYTYNPATSAWTPHNLSLTTGAQAEFEYFLDGFFMVNYSDATRWNNLTQWYTTTNVTNAPKAKYIKLYQSRLYTAYNVTGGITYPSRVIYSDLPSSGTLAWDNTNNYFDVDQDDSDVIKALEVNSNRLMVFKENSLYRYDTNTLYKVPGCPGTVSQRSVKNIQGWTLYFHSTGIWGYDGSSSRLVSRQIKDIIAGVSSKNLASSCAWVRGDHYYLFVGDVSNTEVGLSIDNCLIDYDISKNTYSWRSLNHIPTVFIDYRDDRSDVAYDVATVTYDSSDVGYAGLVSSESRTFFGETLGGVYQFDTGNDFDGTDIPFILETKDYYLGNPSTIKNLKKLQVFADGGKQISIQYKTDDNNWKNLGRLKKTQTELEFPAYSKCRRVKFRIMESSSGDRFSFEGFDIYFTAEGLIE